MGQPVGGPHPQETTVHLNRGPRGTSPERRQSQPRPVSSHGGHGGPQGQNQAPRGIAMPLNSFPASSSRESRDSERDRSRSPAGSNRSHQSRRGPMPPNAYPAPYDQERRPSRRDRQGSGRDRRVSPDRLTQAEIESIIHSETRGEYHGRETTESGYRETPPLRWSSRSPDLADEPRSMPNGPQEIHHAARRLDGLEQESATALGDMDDGDPERQGPREHR
jgi:hypothetical protein